MGVKLEYKFIPSHLLPYNIQYKWLFYKDSAKNLIKIYNETSINKTPLNFMIFSESW